MPEESTEATDSRTDSTSTQSTVGELEHEFSPSMKPAALSVGITVLLTAVAAIYIAVEQPIENADILLWVVLAVGALLVLRYTVRLIVLSHLTYVVTDNELRREYRLFFDQRTRTLPIHQVRAVELDASTLETLLGYGTLRFLSSGSNYGLGFMEFVATNDPERRRDLVQQLITDSNEE